MVCLTTKVFIQSKNLLNLLSGLSQNINPGQRTRIYVKYCKTNTVVAKFCDRQWRGLSAHSENIFVLPEEVKIV